MTGHQPPVPLSVLVLTLNESRNIAACLESVAWADDLWVLDSMSTDCTVDLAQQYGAMVLSRPFDDWSSHQNWALRNVSFRNHWVLYIDADERVSPELASSIQRIVNSEQAADAPVAYSIRRRDHMFGRPLRHAQTTTRYIRLFRPEAISYRRRVNPETVVAGPVGTLNGELLHFPMSHGILQWVSKHVDYAGREALEAHSGNQANLGLRRRIASHVPLKPLARFAYIYALKGGFLDGRAGFRVATLQAYYQYMIELRTEELREGG